MDKKLFIAVAGNIGVGKSSLTRLIGSHLGWHPFFEAVEENPYLADFYENMGQWSFHSQVFFLGRRLQHHRQLVDYPDHVIQDRSIYEDAEIFAENLHRRGLMSQRDYQTYRDVYEGISAFLPPPDLLIYLQAPVGVLAERISQRGRDYERKVSIAYLSDLNELYDHWARTCQICPVYTIQTANMDFVHQPEDFEQIMTGVRGQLNDIGAGDHFPE